MTTRTPQSAADLFPGVNFITNEQLRFGWTDDGYAYEISRGRGILGGTVYGLSFRTADGETITSEQDARPGLYDSLEAVEEALTW